METKYILFLAVWALCLVLIALVSPRKNQSALLWLLLTVFFGPVALLILLLLPSPERPATPRPSLSDRNIEALAAVYKSRSC